MALIELLSDKLLENCNFCLEKRVLFSNIIADKSGVVEQAGLVWPAFEHFKGFGFVELLTALRPSAVIFM